MNRQELLASRIRNHNSSDFSGEASPDDVIEQLLQSHLDGLQEHASEASEAAEKRAELKEDLGLTGEAEATEEAPDASEKRQELKEEILDD